MGWQIESYHIVNSVAPAICGVSGALHIYGGEILKTHPDVIGAERLDNFFTSRDSYERHLRRLVFESSSRIRTIQGTVTGLQATDSNLENIDLVTVKTLDNELSIPSALVVGAYMLHAYQP